MLICLTRLSRQQDIDEGISLQKNKILQHAQKAIAIYLRDP